MKDVTFMLLTTEGLVVRCFGGKVLNQLIF